jgi:nicotinamide-nucleotide amidase
MPESNLRQADIPDGGDAIPNPIGTAPGLRCPVDGKVVYAVPGVPYEMQLMITEQVLPDLRARSGDTATIVSRSLKTWGTSESALAETIAHRVDAQTNPTIAFLARGIEGLVVRVTAKAQTPEEARALVDNEERELRAILGDLVFGVDDETMEQAVLARLVKRGWTLAVAESLTGGLIGARIVDAPGASEAFVGSVCSYATDVKRSVLDVDASPVVSEDAAKQMAEGVRRLLGADVGIAATGVAGPTEQEGVPVGTVCFGLALPGQPTEALSTRLPGDRVRIRQFSTITLLNLLRLRLDAMP